MSQAAIVKVENGQVKVFNSSGSGLYSWGTGTGSQQAVSARLAGDEIHVTRADGWIVICTHSGSQKRMVK
jgi:hypothetical protein